MNRQIIHCVVAVLVLSLCFGCGDTKPAAQMEQVDQEKIQKEIDEQIDGLTRMMLDQKDDSQSRMVAADRAGEMLDEFVLTAEQEAKLVDALEKMIETEKSENNIVAAEEALKKRKH